MGAALSEIDEFIARHGLNTELRDALTTLVAPTSLGHDQGSWGGAHSGYDSSEWQHQPQSASSERYQDLGPLGAGGMGEVRRVLDTKLGRVVALKTLRPEHLAHPVQRARFLEEARATSQLTHPGIVSVFEMGTLPDGRSYFTMALIQGETLGQAFKRQDSLRPKVALLAQAAEALAYAHARGVWHRDFKPANVMVGRFGEVRVVDWGLVRVASDAPEPLHGALGTTPNGVSGTPSYMSPEQARGAQAAATSDVYALGATLYTLLSSKRPFAGLKNHEILAQLREGRVPKLHAGPPQLRRICAQAMDPDPSKRPADAGAFVSALNNWLEDAQARARAQEMLTEARGSLQQVNALRTQAEEAQAEVLMQSEQLTQHAPLSERRVLWGLEDQSSELVTQADLAEIQVIQLLQAAIAEADLDEAHAELAHHYCRQHKQAELTRDSQGATRYEALLRAHDRGTYQDYLRSVGWLELQTTTPATVRAWTYRLVDRHLVPELLGDLGTTPIRTLPLPSGSYLLEISAPGHEVVRLPLRIKRGERWRNLPPKGHPRPDPRIWLPPLGTLSRGEVFVPAGWFQSGDPSAKEGLARRRIWVDDFAIWRTAFTNAQYLEFLNDLLDSGRKEEAARHAPAAMPHGEGLAEQQYGRGAKGHYLLVPDAEGDLWSPQWPVVFVDNRSAQAACAWLAARSGHAWRLPWELEREKATRGVDGRSYSWGDQAQASWSANSQARAGRPTPSDVATYPIDASPYGLMDGCGNSRDHCLDPKDAQHPRTEQGLALAPGVPEPDSWYTLRGGCWAAGIRLAPAALRGGCPQDHRSALNGFRPARSLDRGEP